MAPSKRAARTLKPTGSTTTRHLRAPCESAITATAYGSLMARRPIVFGRPPPRDDPAYEQWIAEFVAQLKAGARSVCPACGENRRSDDGCCLACGARFGDDGEA